MLDICLKKKVSSTLDLHDSPVWCPLRWSSNLCGGLMVTTRSVLRPRVATGSFQRPQPLTDKGWWQPPMEASLQQTHFIYYFLKIIFRIKSKHFLVTKLVFKCGPYNTFSNVVLIDNTSQFLIFQNPKLKILFENFSKHVQTTVLYSTLATFQK